MSFESVLWSLRFVDCPPTEKLILIGIASHDGDGGAWPSEATLAKYAGITERHVRRLVASLVERGLVTVHVNQGGNTKTRGDRRPNLYEVHRPEYTVPATTGGHFDAERVDIQMSTEPPGKPPGSSSSLRSEEELNDQVVDNSTRAAKPAKPKAQNPDDPIAREAIATVNFYWDWFKAENGVQPGQDWQKLRSVVQACLKSEYPADEIIDAMKAESGKTLTRPLLAKRIGETRRERENRPSAAAIPAVVVRAMMDAKPWLSERWPELPTGPNWAIVMQDVTHLVVRFGYGIGEAMMRLAVAMREPRYGDMYWLVDVNVERFPGGLADYPGSMERAYKNRAWKAE